jgi:hypothetical protein
MIQSLSPKYEGQRFYNQGFFYGSASRLKGVKKVLQQRSITNEPI